MSLDETQKQTVRDWIQSGEDLSEIQSKLASELGVSLTYMEVRFLVDDLGLMPQDPEPAPSVEPEPKPETGLDHEAGPIPEQALEDQDPGALGGADGSLPDSEGLLGDGAGVSLSVDQITRPGALASGSVTFSDGITATWTVDQLGRLGLSAEDPGYKPSQEDVMAFQVELQKKLSGPRF